MKTVELKISSQESQLSENNMYQITSMNYLKENSLHLLARSDNAFSLPFSILGSISVNTKVQPTPQKNEKRLKITVLKNL